MEKGIAIVGISAELPGGSYTDKNLDHQSFYQFLLSHGQAYTRFPSDRFNIDAWKGHGLAEVHVDTGSFLKNIETFDNVEFGISSTDAHAMAPVSRKLLENCFLALLDSGIDYRMKKIGCYTSGNSIDLTNVCEPDEYDIRDSFASSPAMMANYVSAHLDLLGPSLPVDTACSSTLTATHIAVQAIRNGECEAAVIGGCQINHRLIDWISYSQGALLAKDGKCKPFDSSADGFGRAEGCVSIVIKPLAAALQDRDRVYATILGTSINSSGAGGPPGAPIAEAQHNAMIDAFRQAGRNAQEVDYIELHATGTAKGDPTEANWVGEAFKRDNELLIGSVKGNIGHAEITSFLASLSKVLSIFQHQVIPPNVNFTTPNPAIRWDEYKLRVPRYPTPFTKRNAEEKGLIAMTSSGIGGSNGHAVLEGPPLTMISPVMSLVDGNDYTGPVLLIAGGLSSRSASAVADSIAGLVKDVLNTSLEFPVLSTILGRRSRQMTWRSYAMAETTGSSSPITFCAPKHSQRKENPIVFVFSGQGPQHKDMGRELFKTFTVFRASVLDMDNIYKKVVGKSMIDDYGLFDGTVSDLLLSDPWPISLILPSILIFQIALFDLLVDLGIKPDIVLGHSAGETAALYASGASSRAMAVEMAIIRGQVFSLVEQLGGTMAAISCGMEETSQILAQIHEENPGSVIEIACFNSPSAVAVAGHIDAVDRAVEIAKMRGVFGRKIRTRVPIHSSLMEVCREEYSMRLQNLFQRYPGPHCPQITTYSTLTGELFSGPYDADYFWNNTRYQVKFMQAIAAIATFSPSFTFVEVAPHPVLSSYISTMFNDRNNVISTVHRPKRGAGSLSEHRDILDLCGRMTIAGHKCVNFTVLNGRTCYESEITLPAYPFQRKQYPLYPDTAGYSKQIEARHGPINHRHLKMNKDTHPSLGQHIIRGEPIMPAAGFMEMAVEFGATTLMDVNMRSILSLSADKPIRVDVKLTGSHWTVKSSTTSSPHSHKHTESHFSERLHAEGYLSFEAPRACPDIDITAIRKRCHDHIGSSFYQKLLYFSSYGPHMQRVTNMYYNANEALLSIRGMDDTLSKEGEYILHPAILDSSIQVCGQRQFHGNFCPNTYYLPAHVDALIVHRPVKAKYFPPHLYAHVLMKRWTPRSVILDITLVDHAGGRLVTLQGLEVAKHRLNSSPEITFPLDIAFQSATHRILSTEESGLCMVLKQVQMPIRTRMLEALDQLAVDMQAGLKVTDHIQTLRHEHQSPEYFDLLVSQSSEHTFNISNGPHIDQAVLLMGRVLCNTLSTLAQNNARRVVRLLITSSATANSLLSSISQAMKEFPNHFYEVFIDKKFSNPFTFSYEHGTTRTINMDIAKPDEQDGYHNSFDVIMALNLVTAGLDLKSIVQTCQALLIPGGSLILTDRNRHAWDNFSSGVTWYNTVYGHPDPSGILHLDSYLEVFQENNSFVLNTHYDETTDPFHFTIEAQRTHGQVKDLFSTPSTPKVPEEFIFEYEFGRELYLQWEFTGLNVSQELEIYVVAKEGRDGGSALGLVRALRREYLLWTIRLVIFPHSYTEEMRLDCLATIFPSMNRELDIVISTERAPTVPRMMPLPPLSVQKAATTSARGAQSLLAADHILIHILASSTQRNVSGFLATVTDDNFTGMEKGSIVVGLTSNACQEHLSLAVDVMSVCLATPLIARHKSAAIYVPGLVAAVLAPGLSVFSRPKRLNSFRILLTHSDTDIGYSISQVYHEIGVDFVQISKDASLFDLARLGHRRFHLIISAYEDQSHLQVLYTLLRPRQGKLFVWSDEVTGLAGILEREPCTIGDALRSALSIMENKIHDSDLHSTSGNDAQIFSNLVDGTRDLARCATFDANKSYLILGGIGSLGVHIAYFMYKRGARHVILTSRSGEAGLHGTGANLIVQRMVSYMRELEGFHISLVAVDATLGKDMKFLVDSLEHELGGCMILTAVLSDRAFGSLSQAEFSTVFAAKVNVLTVLRGTIDIACLDFLVAFSSVSGTFGSGGQANYDAANTALEEAVSSLYNGFSFVCPAITDSSLMLAGVDGVEAKISHLTQWAFTAEDMVCWLDDAISRFQNGQHFTEYIPHLDWEAIDRTLGMHVLGEHLVPARVIEQVAAETDFEKMVDIVRKVLRIPISDFSSKVPLTAYGIDSLSASRLSSSLRSIVEVSQIQLLADISLDDLYYRISKSTTQTTTKGSNSSAGPSKTKQMLDLLEKYTGDMQGIPSTDGSFSISSGSELEVVLLTGSTGALGCNVLSHLLDTVDIARVYAFNRRSQNGGSLLHRQATAFKTHGLPASLAQSPKLVLVEGDLAAPDLGISEYQLDELKSSVTHIIHNAWMVSFTPTLAEFDDLLRGTRALLDFAMQSKLSVHPSLSYISTIGVFQNSKDPFKSPEEPIKDPEVSISSGYSESKWVAERMCQVASDKMGLRTAVIRVGLLTGSVNGYWDASNWVPAMVQSGVYLGCLPDGEEEISWLPADLAAAAIVDMRRAADTIASLNRNQTLHLIHPKPVTWRTIMRPLASQLGVALIPYHEWFACLEGSVRDEAYTTAEKRMQATSDIRAAFKLLDVFRLGMSPRANFESMGITPRVTSVRAMEASTVLRDGRVKMLGPNDAEMWVKMWRENGFLPLRPAVPSALESA